MQDLSALLDGFLEYLEKRAMGDDGGTDTMAPTDSKKGKKKESDDDDDDEKDKKKGKKDGKRWFYDR